MIRLGVNIDHVATVRQARGERYPDPVMAAHAAELGGADNITFHLREDRRHIQDRDAELLASTVTIPLNMEMAATSEMTAIACRLRPHSVTLVPEKREERTTEGGLDVRSQRVPLEKSIAALRDRGILVSLFIEPDRESIALSRELGAGAIEIHTGDFCHRMAEARTSAAQWDLVRPLDEVSVYARSLGLQVHFGHGLNYSNAHWLQRVRHAEEANIGHAIVSRALFVGLTAAVREMRDLLNNPGLRPDFVG